MDGIINYDECLRNIYEEATEEEKMVISNILGMRNLNYNFTSIQLKSADEIIKKYRPDYYKE
jgi:hypothetical protein